MALYFRAHWLIGVALVAVMGLRSIVQVYIARTFVEVSYENSPRRREMGYWSRLLSGRDAAPGIRLSGLAGYLLQRRRRVFQHFLGEIMAAQRRMVLPGLASVTAQEGVALVIVIVLLLALGGNITLGSLVALLYGLSRFRTLADNISSALENVYPRLQYAEYLRDFLALEAEAPAPQDAGQTLQRPLREAIRFHGVSFIYPGSDRPALSNIDLSLRPGERIALVGENGAGKTTLVKLLMGLYRPTSGRIVVDGNDLNEIALTDWYTKFGSVFQSFLRYQTTVQENITFGWLEGTNDEARLETVLTRSGAQEAVTSLPHGLDTPLGKEFHAGAELSVGQWQKLAIARAYFRPAEILILDEPASALDAKAEEAVYRHFADIAQENTAILISHRLASCQIADRILVLREGRLIEQGTHTALLSADGEYAELYRLQATFYRYRTLRIA